MHAGKIPATQASPTTREGCVRARGEDPIGRSAFDPLHGLCACTRGRSALALLLEFRRGAVCVHAGKILTIRSHLGDVLSEGPNWGRRLV